LAGALSFEDQMKDREKILKVLNLCSSANDAEALSALRLAQKMTSLNLGDFLFSLPQDSMETGGKSESDELLDAEAEKLRALQLRYDEMEKKLRKQERDNIRLKRDNKDLSARLEESEKERLAAAERAAKSQAPGEYEILEKLFDAEVEKNDKLKMQLAQKDKTVQKGLRDVSKLKRGKGGKGGEDRVEELEKQVNDLALEVMDLRDRERARKTLSNPQH
jgi:hypothetical protein